MVTAVANDLACLENVHPVVMLDRRLDQFARDGLSQRCQLAWVDSDQAEQQTFEPTGRGGRLDHPGRTRMG